MIKDRIKKLRQSFDKYNIDGYIVPKNDEYFSEYSEVGTEDVGSSSNLSLTTFLSPSSPAIIINPLCNL